MNTNPPKIGVEEKEHTLFHLLRRMEELGGPLAEVLPDEQRLTAIVLLAQKIRPAAEHYFTTIHQQGVLSERERCADEVYEDMKMTEERRGILSKRDSEGDDFRKLETANTYAMLKHTLEKITHLTLILLLQPQY